MGSLCLVPEEQFAHRRRGGKETFRNRVAKHQQPFSLRRLGFPEEPGIPHAPSLGTFTALSSKFSQRNVDEANRSV